MTCKVLVAVQKPGVHSKTSGPYLRKRTVLSQMNDGVGNRGHDIKSSFLGSFGMELAFLRLDPVIFHLKKKLRGNFTVVW